MSWQQETFLGAKSPIQIVGGAFPSEVSKHRTLMYCLMYWHSPSSRVA